MSCHFLIRKPRSIWPPLRIPRRYLLYNFNSFIRTTALNDNLGRMAIKGSNKNIFERLSYMCKIRQINRLVKFYFVTHVLERLSIIWVVPRWWVFEDQAKGYYFCPLWAWVSVNCHHRSCPLNSEILSISCHVFHV